MTYRTLAAVLKYDNEIPAVRKDREKGKQNQICKGYYQSEASIVDEIKEAIAHGNRFKTIECAIMDVADDIAYSTYDLEDAFKAEFLTPLSLAAQPEAVTAKVAATVKARLDQCYDDFPDTQRQFGEDDVIRTLSEIFANIFDASIQIIDRTNMNSFGKAFAASRAAFVASAKLVADGYSRSRLTSDLVGTFIQGVEVTYDKRHPSQSRVRLNIETFKQVEVLKTFAYQSLIMSPRLKVAEHRGKQIVKAIFDALVEDDGHLLMPDDARQIYDQLKRDKDKCRVVCDFIAGMTDRYALQFYSRLFGTSHESIYAPL